jgi:NADH-quinone oxidoreductase subunit A
MANLLNHFLLFILAGIGMLLVPLVIGRFLRPKLPSEEKDAIYECGEPTIGSSYIQFDLRFYTVALLFIIFDVEIAFFFPWALVYGNAMQLADTGLNPGDREVISERLLAAPQESVPITSQAAQTLGLTGFFDILVFFGVLMVGFAYVWKRGDLDWIRAVGSSEISTAEPGDAA